jgi:hypothetical protein
VALGVRGAAGVEVGVAVGAAVGDAVGDGIEGVGLVTLGLGLAMPAAVLDGTAGPTVMG